MMLASHLSRKWTLWALFFGGLVVTSMGSLSYYQMWPIQTLNHLLYDSFQLQSVASDDAPRVVIVDIDEVSLEAVGQWPWPRYTMASLIQAVAKMQPAAIGVDILFTEEDRMALSNIQKVYKKDFNLELDFGAIPPGIIDSDGYLGMTFATTGAVAGQYLHFDYKNHIDVKYASSTLQILGETELLQLHQASAILNNTPRIAVQQSYTGFLNAMPDEDGLLRRLPLLLEYQGLIYPHLSLATLMRTVGVEQAFVEENRLGPVLRVGQYRIPISHDGFMILNFSRLLDAYPSVSASALLSGRVSPEFFHHKTVFIGSSAAGLKDLHHTVLDAQSPAVKTHAVMVDNVLSGTVLAEPSWSSLASLLACIVVTLTMLLLFMLSSNTLLKLSGSILLIALLLTLSWLSMKFYHILVMPSGPIIAIFLLYTCFIAIRFMGEKEAKRAIELKHQRFLKNAASELAAEVKAQTKLLAEAKEKAEQESRVDMLTSLANRRGFLESAHKLISRVGRQKGPSLYFFMIDIDFFKKVNDSYGHAAGDAVLIAVAHTLTEKTRDSDEVFRLGGEEFGLLMNSETRAGTEHLAEQLRCAVADLTVCYEQYDIQVTISTGVAIWVEGGSLDHLMNRADQALYQAKEQGRNQTVFDQAH